MTYLLLNAKYKFMNIIINVFFHHTSVILEQHGKTPTRTQEWFQHVGKHNFEFRYMSIICQSK
jgi:hypothetical protein